MTRSCDSPRRVVITGVGIVSPLGIGFDTFSKNLLEGKSGISRLESVSYSGAPKNVGGEIKDFTDATAKSEYLKKQRKSIKVMCREIQFGVASASMAIENSALDLEAIDHERFGVEFGANLMFSPPDVLKDPAWHCVDEGDTEFRFRLKHWGSQGISNLEPLWLLRYLPNMPACHIGIYADARGPSNSITQNEASGNLAAAEAFYVILRGQADTMVAGTTGTRIHPVKSMHAALWDILADYGDEPPETWCRPFDKTRRGEVLAEGACSMILEEEGHAKARGAKILGRILGAGSSCAFDRNGPNKVTRAIVNAARAAHPRRRPDSGRHRPRQRARPGNALDRCRRGPRHSRNLWPGRRDRAGDGSQKRVGKRGRQLRRPRAGRLIGGPPTGRHPGDAELPHAGPGLPPQHRRRQAAADLQPDRDEHQHDDVRPGGRPDRRSRLSLLETGHLLTPGRAAGVSPPVLSKSSGFGAPLAVGTPCQRVG